MLAIGVDQQPVVAAGVGSLAQARRGGPGRARPGAPGRPSGIPKSGRSISASRARAIAGPPRRPHRPAGSVGGRRHRYGLARAALDDHGAVGLHRDPRTLLAVRPLDPDLRLGRRTEPEVDRAELAADVAAADGQLAAEGRSRRPGPRSRPRSRRGSGRAAASVTPSQWPIGAGLAASPDPTFRQTRTGAPRLTSTRSSRPSTLKSARAAPRPRSKVDDPGRVGRFLRTSRRAGRGGGRSGPSGRSRAARSTLPFETNRSTKPSLLTSWNSGCQAVEGSDVAAGERPGRRHPALEGDVAVGRLGGPGGQRLELVVALAGQVDVGIAVAGHVVAGDAHAPDLHRDPAVGAGVEARGLARCDPPELVLAAVGRSSGGRWSPGGRAGPSDPSR